MTHAGPSRLDRRTVLQYAGLAGVVGLAGCTTEQAGGDGEGDADAPAEDTGPDVYRIGMVNSLTGSLADFGTYNERGVALALEDVNAAGIGGVPLEIIVEDSESLPDAGVSAAQKLVNQDQVPLIIGAVGSGVSTSIYESVIQGTDVVQLSQNSTSASLTEYPGLLRMSPPGGPQVQALADLIAEDGISSVAVAWVNNDFGQSQRDGFIEAWDGEVSYDSPHDQEQSSYASVVAEMANSGADAWVFLTYQEQTAAMLDDAYSNAYEAAFYGSDSAKGPTVLEGTPEGALEGMKTIEPSAAIDQANYQDFASRFESAYGEAPTSWSSFAYDCVITAALSIATADGFTGDALGETVRDVTRAPGETVTTFTAAMDVISDGGDADAIDYDGVSGPIDFDANGDPVGSFQVFEVVDDAYVSRGTRTV